MAIFIALAFIVVPIVEIAVFIKVGGAIGVGKTVALVVLTAIVGTWLLRAQGLSTLRRAQDSLARHVLPVAEVFDGLCLLVAGALLLTPGFVTDAIGLMLFLPPLRAALRRAAWNWLARSEGTSIWINGEELAGPETRRRGARDTIEGEYREIDPGRPDDDGPGGNGAGGRRR